MPECRYCHKDIVLLPVVQRGGKKWPFNPDPVPYDPDVAEQWAYRADRGGVIDLSTTTDRPEQTFVRHTCAEYAQAHVEKLRAEAEQVSLWERPAAIAPMHGRDEEAYNIALKVARPDPNGTGTWFDRIQILAMVCRGEIRAPARFFKGVSYDLPMELAHRAQDITKALWAIYHEGYILRTEPGQVVQLTPAGETQLVADYRYGIDLSHDRPDWLAYEPLVVEEVVDWGKLHANRPAEPEQSRYNLDVAARAVPEVARWRRQNRIPRR